MAASGSGPAIAFRFKDDEAVVLYCSGMLARRVTSGQTDRLEYSEHSLSELFDGERGMEWSVGDGVRGRKKLGERGIRDQIRGPCDGLGILADLLRVTTHVGRSSGCMGPAKDPEYSPSWLH